MWPRFRTSSDLTKKDKKKMKQQPCKSLNVNEEYLCAVRTKSFADFFVKVQLLVNKPSSSSSSSSSQVALDPGQEATTAVLESSSIFSTKSSHHDLKSLLVDYFDISAEASSFCSHLLESLNQLQLDYTSIHQIIDSSDQFGLVFSRDVLSKTFSNMNKQEFNKIHEKHSSVLQRLKSKRKRVATKIKMIKCFNTASGVCVTAACGVVAAAATFLAVHTLTVLLVGPAILSLPMKPLKRRIRNIRFLNIWFLSRVVEQLDVAAKGAYILNRDFDTIGRLVARLRDEVEHNKTMIELCLERREEDRVCLEVLKEIKKYESGFRKQVEELQEHVYLCLVTINRARAMLIDQISRPYQ